MLHSLRRQLGLNRRSRRSVAVVAWLCFLLFALPCAAAPTAACCPGTGSGAVHADADTHGEHGGHGGHGDHDHPQVDHGGHDHDTGDDRRIAADTAHDCSAGEDCCDTTPPTLEDRSPKTPHKPADSAISLATAVMQIGVVHSSRHSRHTTGPPRTHRDAPPTHLEHCRFLI